MVDKNSLLKISFKYETEVRYKFVEVVMRKVHIGNSNLALSM